MPDRSALETLKTEATTYARQGDFSLALPLFEQLQAIEPNEPLWALRVGEILRRIGHAAEAAPAYRNAARLYVEHGEYIKAMAACKFVLLVAPDDRPTAELLARLYDEESRLLAKGGPAKETSAAISSRPAPSPPQPLGGTRVPRVRPPPPPPEALALPAAATPAIAPHARPGSPGRITAPSLSTQRLRGAVGVTPMVGLGKSPTTRTSGGARARAVTVDLPVARAGERAVESRLPSFALFRGLPADALRLVLEHADVTTHPAATVLAAEGEIGGALFVLVDGRAQVTRRGRAEAVAELASGDLFGELALVTDDPRSATVTATTDVQLLSLAREGMNEIVKRHPPLLLRVLAIARDRMVDALFETSPLFSRIEQAERDHLLDRFELREIEPDGVLTEKGKPVDAMHVLLAGNVAVEGADGRPAAMLGAGDVVGELPLLGDQPALATSWATRRTWALALPAASFREVLLASPSLLAALAQNAAMQALRAFDRRVVVA